ncbi:MAG: efflux RND transporter periplasmic adaptor subunit [Akkermansia sp.]|nr:efflux RND transporter periplasmic adaptor subunit [Akkermansia sp.]
MAALLFCSCGEDAEQQSAASRLPVYAVRTAHPQRGDVTEYREWVGQLKGLVSAEILPRVSGYVAQRLFTNGQEVREGQVLYKIDSTLYQQALAEAEQRRAQAAAQEKEAAQHLAYNEPLVRDGAISRQTFTDAQQQLRAAQAALASAAAAVEQAQTNLAYCTLTSPVNGIAGFAQADVGSFVAPSGSPMVLINQVNPIRVQFSISEQDWLNQGGDKGTLRPGAQVELRLANGAKYEYPATIEGVDNIVEAATGSLMLDARTPNPQLLLRPGMYVTVRAAVATLRDVMLVPTEAIVSLQGKNMLVGLDERQRAYLIPVTTGLRQGDKVVVEGKLTPSTTIVVSGTQQALMAVNGRAALKIES